MGSNWTVESNADFSLNILWGPVGVGQGCEWSKDPGAVVGNGISHSIWIAWALRKNQFMVVLGDILWKCWKDLDLARLGFGRSLGYAAAPLQKLGSNFLICEINEIYDLINKMKLCRIAELLENKMTGFHADVKIGIM